MTEETFEFDVVFEVPPEVSDLCKDIMRQVVEFYRDNDGPPSRERVYLVMNALAIVTAVLIASTDRSMYKWFGEAVLKNIQAIAAAPLMSDDETEGATIQ